MAKKYHGSKSGDGKPSGMGRAGMPNASYMKSLPKMEYGVKKKQYVDTMEGIDMIAKENKRKM